LGLACREVAFSQCLVTLAREAESVGLPFTAEHLRHLAGFVLDEAALKYGNVEAISDDDPADGDPRGE
jgi:hypothetical protein